ncbi:TspO protein [Candidatus Curtissbacteria bacterium RIFCSPLOWO2_01_FULL_39_62]|uniref:TspO protein n=2 Tax=Candidatus Curtissiibacteriota TaxID=1752717 RepID=A0A1F5G7E5_9BACT|nr:MAG: TspO protein [Candidatus Curtissbacteria bacterium RIFCSPHIGHO2_01_FULL_39_57]OGD87777.1 MAG: TspO protein [Candidatus Curtissbacteria bacterium RIFCSPHIGHO2_02_FULL_40_16b]OGD90019.1 MAG: TspO protein [Candidatus Curtissbacteria bacterium RIFCSPHIGHO2_12_FULL_38_37]OGD99852.1 MAG: TspO protein [Candidatus Curtissbacteria bacterium RIFCSPLOWO2_02_FULL_40_11]OGE02660.1 MAG: TspO protein [Candidatus Curtissbacteria bacterium RIFCSPLOWO2_01_FULL_39_62]OGE13525.1 MAG: TspO protein [Candida
MNNWQDWYGDLTKPDWTPSGETISTIWVILYSIIFITYGLVFYKFLKKKLKFKVVLPFIINLGANLSFSPFFFGLKNLELALITILVVWLTIIWTVVVIWKQSRFIALAQIPYLIWVTIASILQYNITISN